MNTRTLVLTWASLMLLTLVSMFSAQLGTDTRLQPLPLWSATLLLLVTGFKAWKVLSVYLGLSVAPSSWRGVFGGALCLMLALIAGGYLFAQLA